MASTNEPNETSVLTPCEAFHISPNPPRTWTRFNTPFTFISHVVNHGTTSLDLRRKHEILQYHHIQSKETKKQNFVRNVQTNNRTSITTCSTNSSRTQYFDSTRSGVPGKRVVMELDKTIPLTRYTKRLTYA